MLYMIQQDLNFYSNINWFVKACNQKLKDTFIQDGLGKIGISSTSNINFMEYLKQSSKKVIIYLFCLPITVNVSWLLGHETIGYPLKLGVGKVLLCKKEYVYLAIRISATNSITC